MKAASDAGTQALTRIITAEAVGSTPHLARIVSPQPVPTFRNPIAQFRLSEWRRFDI